METLFTVLLILAMVATAGVLFIGIISFAVGGKFNEKHSNNLMRLRVIMQGVALLMFLAVVLLSA